VPENVPGVPVGLDPPVVVVVGEAGLPDLGRYLMPVERQDADCPTGATGTKVPDWMEPRTS
jgi:hypothetical protein